MPEIAEEIVVSEDGYTFPVMDVLTGRTAVFGKSGSGKSNTANVLAEELLEESLPLLVVDPDGEYYGLKQDYEMLHVGAGGDCDVQVDVEDGPRIADVALAENVPVVLDVSGYADEATARSLVEAVVSRLFQKENDHRKPFLLLVEEIHEYVPESGGLDDLGEILVRVAKRGRKRGLGLCGVSQRPAAVDKDFITQCDSLVWHRLTWKNDTKVVGRILGSEYAEAVQDLDDGEALVMSDWEEQVRRVKFRRKRTYDAGATPSLDDFDEPSLETVDQDLLDRVKGDVEIDDDPPSDPEGPSPTDTKLWTGESGTDDGESATGQSAVTVGPPPEDASPSDPISSDAGDTPPGRPDGGATTNRGNPVWELGQMFVHLFAAVVGPFARLLVWVASRTRRRRAPDGPLAAERNRTVDWKRVAYAMIGLNLLLLALTAYAFLWA